MSLRFSAFLLLVLSTFIATASLVSAAKLPGKPVKGIRRTKGIGKVGTCRCRAIRSARRSQCYYFVNKASGVCGSRRCRPSYVCDRAKGNSICRWKVFRTRVVKDGARTCKVVKHFTRKLVPVRKLSPYYPKMLKFSGARSSKPLRGSARAVLVRPHSTNGFNPKKCLITYKFRSSFWQGYFSKAMKIHKVVLTPNSGRLEQIKSIRVSAGGKTCTLKTRVTRSTSSVVYNCHGAVSKYVKLTRVRGSLEFCGIDAYGKVYRVKPRPRPRPRPGPGPKMLRFSGAHSSKPLRGSARAVLVRPHSTNGFNPKKCLITYKFRSSFWQGYFSKAMKIHKVVLTPNSGRSDQIKSIRVSAGGRTCALKTRVTRSTSSVVYNCHGAVSKYVKLTRVRGSLEFCGIDAYGKVYRVKPQSRPAPFPKPYSRLNTRVVRFYKVRWSGKPQSKASNVILGGHPGTGYNRARCVVAGNAGWWNGYLKTSQPITLVAITNLTGHRSHWKGVSHLRVYSGGKQCRRLTKVTKRTIVTWFSCSGRNSTVIHVKANRKYKLALCGVTAYRLRRGRPLQSTRTKI